MGINFLFVKRVLVYIIKNTFLSWFIRRRISQYVTAQKQAYAIGTLESSVLLSVVGVVNNRMEERIPGFYLFSDYLFIYKVDTLFDSETAIDLVPHESKVFSSTFSREWNGKSLLYDLKLFERYVLGDKVFFQLVEEYLRNSGKGFPASKDKGFRKSLVKTLSSILYLEGVGDDEYKKYLCCVIGLK